MQRLTRTVQWALLLAVNGLAARAQDQTSASDTLTVDDAVRYALQHNPNLRKSELDVEKSTDDWRAYRTKRLPSFKWTVLGGQLLSKPSVTFQQGAFGNFAATGP